MSQNQGPQNQGPQNQGPQNQGWGGGQQPPPQQPYNPQQGYNPQGGYNPQQQGGYPPQQGGYPPQQGGGQPPYGGGGGYGGGGQNFGGQPPQPPKKSNTMIIGIVIAGIVLLVAIGGIVIALSGGKDQPTSTITQGDPSEPSEPSEPASSAPPETSAPPESPSASDPAPTDSASEGPSSPSGDAIDLGNGISLTPAAGWTTKAKKTNLAQLTKGSDMFVGQSAQLDPSSSASDTCTAYHKSIGEKQSDAQYGEAKTTDLGTSKLDGAICSMLITVSSSQGTAEFQVTSLVSIRSSDGLAVVGTVYFTKSSDTTKLNKDFSAMVNSMLKGQV